MQSSSSQAARSVCRYALAASAAALLISACSQDPTPTAADVARTRAPTPGRRHTLRYSRLLECHAGLDAHHDERRGACQRGYGRGADRCGFSTRLRPVHEHHRRRMASRTRGAAHHQRLWRAAIHDLRVVAYRLRTDAHARRRRPLAGPAEPLIRHKIDTL